MTTGSDSADKRINHTWERLALGLLSVVMLWGGAQFTDLKNQNEKLEEKVLFLYTDKVSTSQLKDTENRLIKQIEASNSNILARLDLYFGTYNRNNK